ncbi:MAG: hypothetical protein RMK91_12185 [Pseudanabaenaceae cyanobacterium SKYGB_i_bin29]|nr:hypothetical protein [Pseudanabaenaceae cyanobacterium SKYG29]MDW8422613.1 hypothetical protein [Pseudanabaenaceae cyanobacterium SKYGB_i_bin29]
MAMFYRVMGYLRSWQPFPSYRGWWQCAPLSKFFVCLPIPIGLSFNSIQ